MIETKGGVFVSPRGELPEGHAMARLATLLLNIAGTTCALPRAEIREILPLPRLHAPPAAGGPLAGFLNLAGEPVPVIDLAVLFGDAEKGAQIAEGLDLPVVVFALMSRGHGHFLGSGHVREG